MARRRKSAARIRAASAPAAGESGLTPQHSTGTLGHALPLAVLLLIALVVSAVDLARIRGLWRSLPGPSLSRVDWDAFQQARSQYSQKAREGWILAIVSNHLTTARHHPGELATLLDDARAGAAMLRDTQLGRLQLAALTLLRLEQDNVPPEDWWNQVRGYLDGLERAAFDHFMPELITAEAAAFTRLGLGPGSAQRLALTRLGGKHTPLLQYLAERLQRVADELRQAGDLPAAERCERMIRRLLRQWLLAPGPDGVRLLAAELLADQLDAGAATIDAAELAEKCRRWRTAYRARAASLPDHAPLLRIGDEPAPDAGSTHLGTWLIRIGWTAAALLAAALLGVLSGPAWLRPATHGTSWIRYALTCGAPILILCGSIGVSSFDLAAEDLRRASELTMGGDAPRLGLPLIPIFAGVLSVVVVALSAMIGRRIAWAPVAALRHVAVSAVVTWLLLSIALLPMISHAASLRGGVEAALARPLEAQLRELADPNTDGLLDDLRAWQP